MSTDPNLVEVFRRAREANAVRILTALETGRRRCRIPEHRRQIRTLQAQVRGAEALARGTLVEKWAVNARLSEALARLQAVERGWGWVCRVIGHRASWVYPSSCGRCGQLVRR